MLWRLAPSPEWRRYPAVPLKCRNMKVETLIFGGILTQRCTWSRHTAPSMISTPLYLHNVWMISRTSVLTCPYKLFFLYLGMKTIWYWHFHVVCDKLFLSMWTPPILWVWLATPYSLYHRRLFNDILIAPAYSILPSIAGGLGFSFRYQHFGKLFELERAENLEKRQEKKDILSKKLIECLFVSH